MCYGISMANSDVDWDVEKTGVEVVEEIPEVEIEVNIKEDLLQKVSDMNAKHGPQPWSQIIEDALTEYIEILETEDISDNVVSFDETTETESPKTEELHPDDMPMFSKNQVENALRITRQRLEKDLKVGKPERYIYFESKDGRHLLDTTYWVEDPLTISVHKKVLKIEKYKIRFKSASAAKVMAQKIVDTLVAQDKWRNQNSGRREK